MTLTPARLRAFMRNVEKPAGEDGCWLWRGATNAKGYGVCAMSDGAHRVAYEWMVGPIADGMEVDHLCRNKQCVNPHHLEPVTSSENVRRAKEHGPFALRRYCRRGHALTDKSSWVSPSRGSVMCRACRQLKRVLRQGRHAA